jgi:hypothetical protein
MISSAPSPRTRRPTRHYRRPDHHRARPSHRSQRACSVRFGYCLLAAIKVIIRQRLLVLADLAMTELHGGNFPAACSHVTQAADFLQHASYATGAARLRAFRDAAARPIGPRALRVLDEYLDDLVAY